jgi:Zn-dependent peptidase ImmA (M78 family)
MSSPSTFGERLQLARKMAGLSYQGLADKLQGLVTKQALHKYEQGTMHPDSEKLVAFANALNVTVDFFYREEAVQIDKVDFRKRKALTATHEVAIKSTVRDRLGRYIELEKLMSDEQRFTDPLAGRACKTGEDAEKLAALVREAWGLGRQPIISVYELMEEHGIKVIEWEGPDKFFGLHAKVDGHVVVVVNSIHDNVMRRFTAAHELGHALIKPPADMPEKEQENLCHRFAAAFLIPADEFTREIGDKRKKLWLEELVILKEYWGISLAALMKRALDLEVITPSLHKWLWIQYNRQHMREKEPGEFVYKERTARFKQLLLHALAQEALSLGQAASLMNMKMGLFRRYILESEQQQ